MAELDGQGSVTAVNTVGANGLLSRRTANGPSVFYTFDMQGNAAQRLDGRGHYRNDSMNFHKQRRLLNNLPVVPFWLPLLLGAGTLPNLRPAAADAPRSSVQTDRPASASGAPQIRLTLTVLDGPGLERYTPSSVRHDFTQDRGRGSGAIEYTFRLRNSNPVPLTLARVKTSCRCTQATVNSGAHTRLPFVLKPGQTLRIRVAIRPEPGTTGPIDKFAWVFIPGQVWPAATMEITGKLTFVAGSATPLR